ncbi:MAG TPA: peptidyl-prolyl cis-trans isomerase [Opitutaceae bacterium]|nr:peptidyl-prolyl cis-trans isomerase [Opitutaceae bacterium]
MIVRPTLLGAAAALLLFTGQAVAEDAKPKDNLDLRYENGIVAVVEDKAITVEEVRRELGPLIPELQRQYKTEAEYNRALETLQHDIVQDLIDRVLIIKEFRKDEKKKIPPNFVDDEIAQTQNIQFEGDRSKFLAYLRSKGKTQREYRREVEEDIIYGYMRQQMRKSTSLISPVKIETYYNENKDKFYQDDAVEMRLIQINRNALTDDELRAAATNVITRLNAGEKFEDVAKDVSQDARKNRGGDWGWQKRGDLRKEFVEELFALQKGQFTQPIILPESAYILYVNDRKFAGIQPIEEVRSDIERILVSQMARESQERWLERLRRNGYVKYY